MLHKALAEGAAPDDEAAVIVLNGACEDFAGACRKFVDKEHEVLTGEGAAAVAEYHVVVARGASFGSHNHVAAPEELVGHEHCRVHVASGVAAQVEDKRFCAVVAQLCQAVEHLGVGVVGELAQAQVAYGVVKQVGGVDRRHGHFGTGHGER